MRISILAVGRLGRAPEAALARDYAQRATAAGRALSLAPVDIVEVEARKPGKAAEAEAISPHLAGAHVIACDEHGQALGSRAFADRIARLRDDGCRHLTFVIGGADGLDPALLTAAVELGRRYPEVASLSEKYRAAEIPL